MAGLTLDQLQLSPNAREGARLTLAQFPWLQFTSGRRDPAKQAKVMAKNVLTQRDWIQVTYKPSLGIDALQHWVNGHPEADTLDSVTAGLSAMMQTMDPLVLRSLSRHLTGDAWDCAWPRKQTLEGWQDDEERGAEVKAFILSLPEELGLEQVLIKEGSLKLIHAAFA